MLCFSLFILIFFSSCLYDPHQPDFTNEYLEVIDLTDNMLFYHFNEGSYSSLVNDIIDSTGNSKNSTTQNNPTSTEGVYGNAIMLNGTNQCANLTPSDFDSAFTTRTVSVWFKADALNGTQIIYEEGGNTNGQNIYLYNDQLYAGVYKSTKNDVDVYLNTTTVALSWQHVATVYDKDVGFKLYYNGELVNTGSVGGHTMSAHSDDNGLGCVQSDSLIHTSTSSISGSFFKGVIDEYAIWTRALSAQEIKIIYQRQGRY
jgi:hypothetical protein